MINILSNNMINVIDLLLRNMFLLFLTLKNGNGEITKEYNQEIVSLLFD